MDLILAITDDGSSAKKAVAYASHLAKRLKTDILIAPAAKLIGNAAGIDAIDDAEEPDTCAQDVQHHLVKYIVIAGDVYYGASGLMTDPKLEQLLLNANAPVIIISEDVPVRYTEKFVFLTDITADDSTELGLLCGLADLSAASVMLTQLNAPRLLNREQQAAWDMIMKDKISATDYGRIYHYNIPDNMDKPDIQFIIKNCRAEALAIVHPQGGLIDGNILNFGFKNALYGSLKIPLVIFPSSVTAHKN